MRVPITPQQSMDGESGNTGTMCLKTVDWAGFYQSLSSILLTTSLLNRCLLPIWTSKCKKGELMVEVSIILSSK
jgi:hypothetical protein